MTTKHIITFQIKWRCGSHENTIFHHKLTPQIHLRHKAQPIKIFKLTMLVITAYIKINTLDY